MSRFLTYHPNAFLWNDLVSSRMPCILAYVDVMSSSSCFCHVHLPGRHSPVSSTPRKTQMSLQRYVVEEVLAVLAGKEFDVPDNVGRHCWRSVWQRWNRVAISGRHSCKAQLTF